MTKADPTGRRLHVVLIGYAHGHGGIQTHCHWLAKGLSDRGHRVELLSPAPMTGHEASLPCRTDYAITEYRGWRDVWCLARARSGKSEAVVITGTGWKAMLLAVALRPTEKRVFFEVMSGERSGRFDPRDLTRLGFNAIVGQGSGVERMFVRDFGWTGSSTVIPALPEPLERISQVPIPPRLPQRPDGRLRLAYFSRLVPYKGAGFLIENWSRLAEHAESLDIWGTGSAHDEFAAKIAEAGLGDIVRLKGRYPGGQAYVDLLQSYDMTLLPTWGQEGAPLVLLESMACGIPFVANGVGGIPDYANRWCEVTEGDVADFLPLYDRLARRIRSGGLDTAALQAHYRDNFSFERLVERWEAFLQAPLADSAKERSLS